MELTTGLTYEIKEVVTDSLTASVAKSGGLPVYATPFMIALMEQTAAALVQPYLPEGITTVGTMVSIQHLAATAVGAEVKAIARLVSFDNRKFCFEVEAYDNAGLIGKGTHERFSVKIDKFMQKTEERKAVTNA